MNRFQVLAVNDEKDFCECCGKKNLKRVVFVRDTETDEVKHFGTSCAVAPAKGFNIEKEVKAAIERQSSYEKTLNALTHYAYRDAGGKHVAKADGVSWTQADPMLYAKCRAAVIAKGFNY